MLGDSADAACAQALDFDLVNVTKIASMLEKASKNTSLPPPGGRGRHRPTPRDPAGAANVHSRYHYAFPQITAKLEYLTTGNILTWPYTSVGQYAPPGPGRWLYTA